MKHIIINISFLFILGINNSYGQEIDDYSSITSKQIEKNMIVTSPEAYSFQLINTIPMDLSTGRINLEIPIYEIKEGNITIPIKLIYNSNGIKINEPSGNVGMNWTLSAGGNINKIVRDLDDNKYLLEDALEKCNGGNHELGLCLYGRYLVSKGKNVLENEVEGTSGRGYLTNPLAFYNEDIQYDLFVANAPGLSSSFTIEKNSNSSLFINNKGLDNSIIKLIGGYNIFDLEKYAENAWIGSDKIFRINNNAYKDYIESYYGPGGNYIGLKKLSKDYGSFIITNNNGIIYEFSTYDINTSIPMSPIYSTADNFGEHSGSIPQLMHILNNYNINKNTWNLDKIKDPITGKIISYNYKKIKGNVFYENIGGSASRELDKDIILSSDVDNIFYNSNTLSNYIEEISWSSGKVKFIYKSGRLDAPDKESLSEIRVTDLEDNLITIISFNYSYYRSFNDNVNTHNYTNYRLRLDEINFKDKNSSTIKKHSFSYLGKDDNPNYFPNINDFVNQDYFGYYKKNDNGDISYTSKFPKLYYKENEGKYSFIPFPFEGYKSLQNITNLGINYTIDRSVINNDSNLGLLVKYKNPSGSIHEFDYESNTFKFKDKEIKGGGSRVIGQVILDNNSTQKKKIYSYDLVGASGNISNLPQYSVIELNRSSTNNKFVNNFSTKSMGRFELTNNSFVTYSRVAEIEVNKGYELFYFTTNDDYPNLYPYTNDIYLQNNSVILPGIYEDYSGFRGKLLKHQTFSNTGSLLKEITNEYSLFSKLYFSPYLKRWNTSEVSENFRITNKGSLFYEIPNFYGDLRLKKTSSKSFFGDKAIENSIFFDYTNQFEEDYLDFDNNYQIQDYNINYDQIYLNKKQEINSKGENVITEYLYPSDLINQSNYSILDKELLSRLITENRISEPIVTKQKVADNYVSEVHNKYSEFNGIIQKSAVFQKKGSGIDITKITDRIIEYNSYDTKGNLTQYTPENGIPVSIIWGYNGQYPVAKIEGSIYTDVVSKLSSYLTKIQNGTLTATEETTIRGLIPTSMITTYQYKPLIGVTKIVQPNGLSENYKYDSANRLEEIRNDKGELLKSFKYNYKQ